jgi:TonB family protein
LQAQSTGWLEKRIEMAVKASKTEIVVSVYQQPADTPMPLVQSVFRAMVQPVPIYNASNRQDATDKSVFYLGEFVYVDGGFRYLERQVLQALSTAPPMRLRIGGNVQSARIIDRIQPVYPALARENRIQGTVPLHVIVAKDGAVAQVEVLGGDPALQMAAVDAVRQWRYQPTLLNGMPVEVDTQVNVTFTLH